MRLPSRTSDRMLRGVPLREPAVEGRYSFRFCMVPPTAPIEHMLANASR